jgi:YVTN family beta-propeller protein
METIEMSWAGRRKPIAALLSAATLFLAGHGGVVAASAAQAGKSALGRYPERVYVPTAVANMLHVIDPKTFKIVATYEVGLAPHHVTPSWDLTRLYVTNTGGNTLSEIDPQTGTIARTIPVVDPYNLYFTPDGKMAIAVAERFKRLDFLDSKTWKLIKSVHVQWPGVDHLAFSRDGSYLVASCEWSGRIVKVDLKKIELVEDMALGKLPIDVVRPPRQNLMFIADQGVHGVFVVDPDAWKLIEFVPTGRGAHGILLSHDETKLYVSNRLEGTISVLDIATRKVVAKWKTGGSPDMGQLSPDGSQLWISSRYHATVLVIDTTTGKVLAWIPTEKEPHGLTYFPNSRGTRSVGHNGVYLLD